MSEQERLLRLPEVIDLCGLKSSAIYDRIKNNMFPIMEKRGRRTSVWRFSMINSYINGQVDWEEYNNEERFKRGMKPVFANNVA